METLQAELKQMIIETLHLEGLQPEDIDSAAPLFVEGLGLDSIDALELGLAIKSKYGIVLSEEQKDTRRHFQSIDTLAAFIQSQQGMGKKFGHV